ncbi:hypothetical protein Acid345_3079 [Candidatus Koribacter versatilis Ellin345]|uniref:Uncharacterized protein n=1 Tax=Koribacter versatilis (strain Ellin345) TaxID=204669 RepID=Q1IM20_KORVE|nr:hypothetical protein [Candidatus Koribacter versatilis]ABF42080.1 hypothetical protein Acid345_3079 [Candidatus Koribacter versatilis Ellin345]
MRSRSTMRRSIQAEFVKIWHFRFTSYGAIAVITFTSLIAYDLLKGEDLRSHVALEDWSAFLPFLFFASWEKMFAIQMLLMVMATYCVAVDSQYGMIKIGCSFPCSRTSYANSKLIAVGLHGLLIVVIYISTLVCWSGFAGSWQHIGWASAGAVWSFSLRLLFFSACFIWLVPSLALLRRTLLEAFVTVMLSLIVFLFLNFMPMRAGLAPYLSFRYLYYPIAPLITKAFPVDKLPNLREPLWRFGLANVLPPALLYLWAVVRLNNRDITE